MANEWKHIKIVFLTLFCIGIYAYLYVQTSRNLDISKNILENFKQSLNMQHLILKNDQLASSFVGGSFARGVARGDLALSKSYVTSHNEKTDNETGNLTSGQKRERLLRKAEELNLEETIKEFSREKKYRFPVMTMFTSWSVEVEKFLCRNTTVVNWSRLKPFITPILFTNNTDLIIKVRNKGWKVLPVISTGIGIPVLKDMFLAAMNLSKSTFYAYANGDILFTTELVKTVLVVQRSIDVSNNTVLIIGQRTNVKNISIQVAESFELLKNISKQRGKLFTEWGEDYFITGDNYPWDEMPGVVIGRRAYDNFLVIESLKRGFIVIDATKTILAVHHTTKSGNFENRKKRNNSYNAMLISKYYKNKTVSYSKGLTKCANYYTKFLSNATITLLRKRKPNC